MIDFAHVHHRDKGSLRYLSTLRHCIGQNARRSLPVDAPFVLAPAAHAWCAAIVDNGVPIAVGFILRIGRDLK